MSENAPRRPGRPARTTPRPSPLAVRFPPELYQRIVATAQREERSINGQLVRMVRDWYEAHPNG